MFRRLSKAEHDMPCVDSDVYHHSKVCQEKQTIQNGGQEFHIRELTVLLHERYSGGGDLLQN